MIFSHFDDLDTLRAAALCCRTFYEVVVRIDKLITTEILLSQIHPTVMPDAITVHASFALSSREDAALELFSTNNLSTKTTPPTVWKLSEALPLSRFHNIVSYFAKQLSLTALNRARDELREPPRRATPTDTEVRRVQRALYRFQLYCNMFDRKSIPVEERRQELFFSHFSTWENEQLFCARDLLVGIFAERKFAAPNWRYAYFANNSPVAYNDLVDHDVRWGCLPRWPITFDEVESKEAEYALSKGLEFLFRLVRTDDYAERRELLIADVEPGHETDDEPGRLDGFLGVGLSGGRNPVCEHVPLDFLELDDEQKASFIGKPFYDDPDPGPAAACESLIARDQLAHYIILQPFGVWWRLWRLWGYVFWDASRPVSPQIPNLHVNVVRDVARNEFTIERRQLLNESREERAKIRQKGGSGWWSFEDQSKVVWERPY